MANDPVILSEEPKSIKINIQDPSKSKQQVKGNGGKMIQKQQKIPFWDRIIGALFGNDVNSHNIGEHFINDWAIPTGKRMINNGIQSGLKRAGDATQVMLYGKVINSSNGPVDYTSFSNPNAAPVSQGGYRVTEKVDVFAFRDRQKAEECLAYLRGRLQTYKSVGVLDYFEWINDNLNMDIPLDYNMADKGWFDLSNVRVTYDPNGFIIDFPRPVFLKRG